MKKIVVAIWVVLLVVTSQSRADIPEQVQCENLSGAPIFLAPEHDLAGGLDCRTSFAPIAYGGLVLWWNEFEHGQKLRVTAGNDRQHQVPIFSRAISMIATETLFSMSQYAQEGVFENREYVFDVFRRSNTLVFRIVSIPFEEGEKN